MKIRSMDLDEPQELIEVKPSLIPHPEPFREEAPVESPTNPVKTPEPVEVPAGV